jgi:drug/metabolite transporter (DMT)-like permease
MAMRSDRLDLTAILVMLALCALWGLNQVSIKVTNGGISPVMQAGLRSLGAALLVWGWARWRGIGLWQRDGTLGLGIIIALLFAGEFTLLNWSLAFSNASRVVVFLYLAPFVVALGGHLFIPGERLGPLHVVGLIAAFAGMTLAFADALRLPTSGELAGDVLAVGAAVLWGTTTVVVKATRLARISPHKMLLYQLVGSAAILPALALAMGERGVFAPTPLVLWSLLYQTVVVAGVSYLAWFWLITRYPAFKLAAFSFLTPLFGLLAGALLLGEAITPALVFAMLLVGAGIYLVNRGPLGDRSAARQSAAPATGD